MKRVDETLQLLAATDGTKTSSFHIEIDWFKCRNYGQIILTLLDLSGLFNAERTGLAHESQDDGTHSFSFSEMLLSSNTSSAESASAIYFGMDKTFWMNGHVFLLIFQLIIGLADEQKR